MTALAQRNRSLPVTNASLAMGLLIASETILFTVLLGAYLVLRFGSVSWPPAGVPPFELGVSVASTGVLTLSAFFMVQAQRFAAREWRGRQRAHLAVTLLFGALFVALQSVEFHGMYSRGLTWTDGVYGALFYTIVAFHALHVLGGLGILAWAARTLPRRMNPAAMYWYFVVGAWYVLFGALYTT